MRRIIAAAAIALAATTTTARPQQSEVIAYGYTAIGVILLYDYGCPRDLEVNSSGRYERFAITQRHVGAPKTRGCFVVDGYDVHFRWEGNPNLRTHFPIHMFR